MSIKVKQIILHQIDFLQQETEIQFNKKLREAPLAINDEVQQMMLQLNQSYQSKSLGYGTFNEHSAFASYLNALLNQEMNFIQFSHYCVDILGKELRQYAFAESGTVIFCEYNFLATDYLFIALLDNRNSLLVDEALDIHHTSYLNIYQYDIAARINLTELQTNATSNRYLSFIKGRVGRRVADFFMDFMGASSGFDAKEQNLVLLQAVNDFCKDEQLSLEQENAIKKQTFDYCKGQIKANEEILLDELSAQLPRVNEKSFQEFQQEHQYQLAESIPVVANALKSLTKFSGSGNGVQISFDVELLNQRVIWNEAEDSLIIKGIPANLKDLLRKNSKNMVE